MDRVHGDRADNIEQAIQHYRPDFWGYLPVLFIRKIGPGLWII